MLTTVEDSHCFVVRNEAGVPSIDWDTRKFYKGRTYNNAALYAEWKRQAKYFVDNGWALVVK